MDDIWLIWFLIGAAFVFFMQAGFAMLEAGLTRAKNTANILMKNLMDFCLGTVGFLVLGAGLLLGEDTLFGLIGIPNFDWITNFTDPEVCSKFFFNLVFCATAATIVSGAVAERTKFSAYCIYSFVISLVVYPIEAHWVWGEGGCPRSASMTLPALPPFTWRAASPLSSALFSSVPVSASTRGARTAR